MRIFLLDTSAILSGKPLSLDGEMVTVPAVEKEMAKRKDDYNLFLYLQEKGLKIFKPSKKSVEQVDELARKRGEDRRLSPTDKELLALAIELRENSEVVLVTDDYSMQNLADFFEINYTGVSQKGISKRFVWMYKCKGCGKIFKRYVSSCPVCGSPLRTFVKSSRDVKK